MIDRRRNKPNPKLIDTLHRLNLSWIVPRKKYWIAGLVVAVLLLVSAIVVPISLHALSDGQSLESTTIQTVQTSEMTIITSIDTTSMTTISTASTSTSMSFDNTTTTAETTYITSTSPTVITTSNLAKRGR